VQRAEQRAVLEAAGRELERETHILTGRPHLLWQQLFGRLQWADGVERDGPVGLATAAELRRRVERPECPWARNRVRPRESGALLRTLTGHSNVVTSVAFSPDGNRFAGRCAHRLRRARQDGQDLGCGDGGAAGDTDRP